MNKKYKNLFKKGIEEDKKSSQKVKNWLLERVNNATKPNNNKK